MYLNPDLFFIVNQGELVAWDYKSNQEWSLEPEYFIQLLSYGSSISSSRNEKIELELLQGGLISNNEFQDDSWGWGPLAKIFHYGTKDCPQILPEDDLQEYAKKYIEICGEIYDPSDEHELYGDRDGEGIILPPPDLSVFADTSLLDSIRQRLTSRSFVDTDLDIEDLSTILFMTFGHIHGEWDDLDEKGLRILGTRKAHPSGGAIHPSAGYVVARRIKGLKEGIYYYRCHKHELVWINDVPKGLTLGSLVAGQKFIDEASAGLIITSRFDRIWKKYAHSRGYRVALLDIGHLSQTFHLCAAAMNLCTWLSGIINDSRVEGLLGISDTHEQALFFLALGKGHRTALYPEVMEALSDLE